jgi:hypothetical protein
VNTHTVNVLLRISGELGAIQKANLKQVVDEHCGVIRTSDGARSDHLILVDYDPFATTAQQILATVRGRGCDARLIGL